MNNLNEISIAPTFRKQIIESLPMNYQVFSNSLNILLNNFILLGNIKETNTINPFFAGKINSLKDLIKKREEIAFSYDLSYKMKAEDDNFIYILKKDIDKNINSLNKGAIVLFLELIKNMNNKNEFSDNLLFMIDRDYGIQSFNAIKEAKKVLIEKNFLLKKDNDCVINPFICGKQSIENILQLQNEYKEIFKN